MAEQQLIEDDPVAQADKDFQTFMSSYNSLKEHVKMLTMEKQAL